MFIVVMEEVIDQMFDQQGESLLLRKKGKMKRKEKDMQLRTMNMQGLSLQRMNLMRG